MHTQTPGFTTFKDKILILYVLVIAIQGPQFVDFQFD
jgi:hypothetical protein